METSTGAWVNNAKKVLTKALPCRMCDADDNANNFSAVFFG